MLVDVVTEQGTVYRMDLAERRWMRFPRKGSSTPWSPMLESIWSLKAGEQLTLPWADEESWVDADEPVLGKHMYIAGKDLWFVSQKVVAIVPIDDWDSDVSSLPENDA